MATGALWSRLRKWADPERRESLAALTPAMRSHVVAVLGRKRAHRAVFHLALVVVLWIAALVIAGNLAPPHSHFAAFEPVWRAIVICAFIVPMFGVFFWHHRRLMQELDRLDTASAAKLLATPLFPPNSGNERAFIEQCWRHQLDPVPQWRAKWILRSAERADRRLRAWSWVVSLAPMFPMVLVIAYIRWIEILELWWGVFAIVASAAIIVWMMATNRLLIDPMRARAIARLRDHPYCEACFTRLARDPAITVCPSCGERVVISSASPSEGSHLADVGARPV